MATETEQRFLLNQITVWRKRLAVTVYMQLPKQAQNFSKKQLETQAGTWKWKHKPQVAKCAQLTPQPAKCVQLTPQPAKCIQLTPQMAKCVQLTHKTVQNEKEEASPSPGLCIQTT